MEGKAMKILTTIVYLARRLIVEINLWFITPHLAWLKQ